MTLIKCDRKGYISEKEDFASAEALAQTLSLKDAVVIGDDVFWMPDTQRLEMNPPMERKRLGARAYTAKTTSSKNILRSLANDTDVYVLWHVASNDATDDVMRDDLEKKGIFSSLIDIAKNENRSPVDLASLSDDHFTAVREQVARNTNAPPEILASLAIDSDHDVRFWVAMNPNAPSEALASLAKSQYAFVREAVAKHANTPLDILFDLSYDKEPSVHVAAQANRKSRKKPRAVKKKKP